MDYVTWMNGVGTLRIVRNVSDNSVVRSVQVVPWRTQLWRICFSVTSWPAVYEWDHFLHLYDFENQRLAWLSSQVCSWIHLHTPDAFLVWGSENVSRACNGRLIDQHRLQVTLIHRFADPFSWDNSSRLTVYWCSPGFIWKWYSIFSFDVVVRYTAWINSTTQPSSDTMSGSPIGFSYEFRTSGVRSVVRRLCGEDRCHSMKTRDIIQSLFSLPFYQWPLLSLRSSDRYEFC